MHNIKNLPTTDINISWFEQIIRFDTATVICAWTVIVALLLLCVKQHYIQRNWINPPPWREVAGLLGLSAINCAFLFSALLNYQYQQTALYLGIHAIIFMVGAGIVVRYFVLAGYSQNELRESLIDTQFALAEHREQLERIVSRRTNVLRREIVETRSNQRQLLKIAHGHEEELNFARNMQQALLTKTPDLSFVDMSLFYNPADAISGDTYSIVHDKKSIRFVLADAMGHGISAALLTQVVLTVSQEQPMDARANEVFEKINSLLARHPTGGYLTASWLYINQSGLLEFCGAGNAPLLIWRKHSRDIEMLDGAGQALGMFDSIFSAYETQGTQLAQGDRVFLFTDGLLEWTNPERELFGIERIADTIGSCADDSVEVAVAGLQNTAWEFANMQDCTDDVTIIALEYLGAH